MTKPATDNNFHFAKTSDGSVKRIGFSGLQNGQKLEKWVFDPFHGTVGQKIYRSQGQKTRIFFGYFSFSDT